MTTSTLTDLFCESVRTDTAVHLIVSSLVFTVSSLLLGLTIHIGDEYKGAWLSVYFLIFTTLWISSVAYFMLMIYMAVKKYNNTIYEQGVEEGRRQTTRDQQTTMRNEQIATDEA